MSKKDEKPGKLRINGKVYEIPADYKIREYRKLTEMTGATAISEIDFSNPEAIAAVTLILLQRENPDFTEDELDEMVVGFEEGDDSPPVRKPRK